MIVYFIFAIMGLLYGLMLGLGIMHIILKPKIEQLEEIIWALQDELFEVNGVKADSKTSKSKTVKGVKGKTDKISQKR